MSNRKRGRYRLELPVLGICARVDDRAGDAAPYLERAAYEALGFSPSFDNLPWQSERDRLRDKPLWASAPQTC